MRYVSVAMAIILAMALSCDAAQSVLTWTHTPTAEQPIIPAGFQVLYCQGEGCIPVDLAGATTGAGVLTYTHSGIAALDWQCYQVVALAPGLRSLPSERVCGRLPPAPPDGLTVHYSGTVTLTIKP